MKDLGNELIGRRHGGNGELRPQEFWAVKDVSFNLKRGECLGLIGHNGAGKTTLLRMLNGLIKPDKGRIEIRGKVGALIALGAGFNPILTGRENIYVNASVLGLSKREIDDKIEEIINFAEIDEFIDSPVQSYSSGMQVRLGFAVATALKPDVLILDEVLAVGDAAFRSKCYKRMSEIKKKAALIFVSHSMEQIARISNSTLVLNAGLPTFYGDVSTGVDYYEKLCKENGNLGEKLNALSYPIVEFDANPKITKIISGQNINYLFHLKSLAQVDKFQIRLYMYDSASILAAEGIYESEKYGIKIKCGNNKLSIKVNSFPLKNGVYKVSINIITSDGELLVWCRYENVIEISGGHAGAIAHCLINDVEIVEA
jgi:lipopolysaccharide transport system ATP-binding protein